jgi:hypothetical protein
MRVPVGWTLWSITSRFFVVWLLDLLFVFSFVDDFEHGARLGEVESFFGGECGADDVGRVGFGVESYGVVRGELEAVEECGGSLGVELSGGEGVDDDGEGYLDGLAVFEGSELDVLAGYEVGAGGSGGPVGAVALVEA